MSLFKRCDSNDLFFSLLSFCKNLNLDVQALQIVNLNLGRQSIGEFGLTSLVYKVKTKIIQPTFFYLCGVDLEINKFSQFTHNSFIVFQGSYSNNIQYYLVNIILPVKVYVESAISFLILRADIVKLQ